MRILPIILAIATAAVLVSCAADMPVVPGAGATVEGIVVDREGSPVEHVRLFFQPFNPQPRQPYTQSAETEADGTYSLELDKGAYRVQIVPPFDAGYLYARVDFTVHEGENRLDHRYTGALMSGTATGPGGTPLSEFRVYASLIGGEAYGSASGTNGAYWLVLPPGRYIFQAAPEGFPFGSGLPRFEFQADISAQDTTVNLDFSGHAIEIQVSLNGVPLPATNVGATSTGVIASSRTDILGEATLYLPSGGYTMTVESNAHGITGPEQRFVDVHGPGSVPIDLTGVRWNVTVRRSSDLEPVPQAQVDVREVGGAKQGYAETDHSGTFSMVVRPDWIHEIQIIPPSSFQGYVVSGIISSADSTFDLLVDLPLP
jgi:hypothetical protein